MAAALVIPALAAAQTAPADQPANDQPSNDQPAVNRGAATGQTTTAEPTSASPDRRVPPAQQTITLNQAIADATGAHPAVEQARAEVRVATADLKQARAHYGPSLSASASAQLWNDDIQFSASPGGGADAPELPPPSDPYEQVIAGLFGDTEPTTVRDQFTASLSVTLSQPLGPLWTIYHSVQASEYARAAAEVQVDQATRDQARRAATSYFQVLQARAAVDTARQSVDQLHAQVDQVRALVEAGAAKKADQLRIEVALAAAQQRLSEAKSRLQLGRTALAVAVNRDPQRATGAEQLGRVTLPEADGDPSAIVDQAEQHRPELKQLRLRQQQADEGVKIAQGQYIPQLVALAQYSHNEGQGLSGSNSAFVGLSLDWNIWEWGADYYGVQSARAQRVKLDSTYLQTRRQIGLQVKQAWYDLQSAVDAYSVALKSVDQAREAYRVEQVRYEAGESTPTDLLDAQSALTEAQNNRNTALFQALIKNADLIYATGKPLTAGRLVKGGK